MDSKGITWLHVSDLHRGQTADPRWLQHRHALFDDMKGMIENVVGQPDFIVFTGDLTQQGLPEQFDLVDDSIREIREVIGDVPVLPVPGNHDLIRPEPKRLHLLPAGVRHYLAGNDDAWLARQEMMANPNGIVEAFSGFFKNYDDWFQKKIKPQFNKAGWSLEEGRLPGDYRVRLTINDITLGIAGVNSAFLDYQDGIGEGEIAVENGQLCADPDGWTRRCNTALLLMHHPPKWVAPSLGFPSNVYTSARFAAALYGHVHAIAPSETSDPETRRYCPAPSLAGVEKYLGKREDAIFGYCWGRIERESDDPCRGRLSYWVRRVERSNGGEPGVRAELNYDPHEFKDIPLRQISPIGGPSSGGTSSGSSTSSGGSTSAPAPHVRILLDSAFSEAQTLYDKREFASARLKFQMLATAYGTDSKREIVQLMSAISHLQSGNDEQALLELKTIDAVLLEQRHLPALGSALAQAGSVDDARALTESHPAGQYDELLQLCDIIEERVPTGEPVSPNIYERGAAVKLAKGDVPGATQWVLHALGQADDSPEVVANATETLLNIVEAVLHGPLHGNGSVAKLEATVASLVSAGSPAEAVVGNVQMWRWRCRLAAISSDILLVGNCRRELRAAGGDENDIGGRVRFTDSVQTTADIEPGWTQDLAIAEEQVDNVSLHSLVALYGRHPRVLVAVSIVRAAFDAGNVTLAVEYATRAMEAWPGSGHRKLLAHARLLEGQPNLAMALLEQTTNSQDEELMRMRALALSSIPGRELEGADVWRRYLEKQPNDLGARVNYAWSSYRAGAHEQLHSQIGPIVDGIATGQSESPEVVSSAARLVLLVADESEAALLRMATAVHHLSTKVPAAAGLYLFLWSRLGSPTSLPAPNFRALAESGALQEVRVEDAITQLTQQTQFSGMLWAGYRRGAVPFEAAAKEAGAPIAQLVVDFYADGRGFTVPPVGMGGTPVDLRTTRILTGELELCLLQMLGLLTPLLHKFPNDRQLVLFEDVYESIQVAPLRIARRASQGELAKLMSLANKVGYSVPLERAEVSEVSDAEWCLQESRLLIAAGESNTDRASVSLPVIIKSLIESGHLPRSVLKTVFGAENALTVELEMPLRLAFDFSSLVEAESADLLRRLRMISTIDIAAGPEARAILAERVSELRRTGEAKEIAVAIQKQMARALESGTLCLIPRPEVEVPEPAEGRSVKYRAWIVEALAWLNALQDDEEIVLLSADLLAWGLIADASSLQLLGMLRWDQQRELYKELSNRRLAVSARKISLPSLLRSMKDDHNNEQVREKLLRLGFAGAYQAEDVIELANEYRGLTSEVPARILGDIERFPSASEVHLMVSPVASAALYAETIWQLWKTSASVAAPVTSTLLERLAALSEAGSSQALRYGFYFLCKSAVRDFQVSAGPPVKHVYQFAQDSTAGVLWDCVRGWIGGDGTRLEAFRGAFAVVLAEQPGGVHLSQTTPLMIAANGVDAFSAKGEPMFASAFEMMTITSATWPESPLSSAKLAFSDGSGTRECSWEDIQEMAARKLVSDDRESVARGGREWHVGISFGGDAVMMPVALEALVLRMKGAERADFAKELANYCRVDDGRSYRLLLAISADPTSSDAARAFAHHTIRAPWRRVRSLPSDMLAWGSNGDFPHDSHELRELLSEPELGGAPIVDEIVGRTTDEWTSDLYFAATKVPGALSASLFQSRLSEGDALRPLKDHPNTKAVDLPVGDLVQSALALVTACSVVPDSKEECQELLATLLHGACDFSGFAAIEHKVLVACSNVVARLSARQHDSVRQSVWLTWRLYGWLVRQIHSFDGELSTTLERIAYADGVAKRPALGEVLDPARFGPDRFEHRIGAVLQALSMMTSETLTLCIGNRAKQLLEDLTKRSPSDEELELAALPKAASRLGWQNSPRSIPALAQSILDQLVDERERGEG